MPVEGTLHGIENLVGEETWNGYISARQARQTWPVSKLPTASLVVSAIDVLMRNIFREPENMMSMNSPN